MSGVEGALQGLSRCRYLDLVMLRLIRKLWVTSARVVALVREEQ